MSFSLTTLGRGRRRPKAQGERKGGKGRRSGLAPINISVHHQPRRNGERRKRGRWQQVATPRNALAEKTALRRRIILNQLRDRPRMSALRRLVRRELGVKAPGENRNTQEKHDGPQGDVALLFLRHQQHRHLPKPRSRKTACAPSHSIRRCAAPIAHFAPS